MCVSVRGTLKFDSDSQNGRFTAFPFSFCSSHVLLRVSVGDNHCRKNLIVFPLRYTVWNPIMVTFVLNRLFSLNVGKSNRFCWQWVLITTLKKGEAGCQMYSQRFFMFVYLERPIRLHYGPKSDKY